MACSRLAVAVDRLDHVRFERRHGREAMKVLRMNEEDVSRDLAVAESALQKDGSRFKDIIQSLRKFSTNNQVLSLLCLPKTLLIENLTKKVDALETDLEQMFGEIAELRAQIREVEKDSFIKTRVDENVFTYKEEVAKSEDTLKDLKRKLEVMNSEHDLLQEEFNNSSLNARLRAIEGKLVDCQLQEADVEQKHELAKKQLQMDKIALQSDPKCRELVNEMSKLEKDLSDSKQRLEKHQEDVQLLAQGLLHISAVMAREGHPQAITLDMLREAGKCLPLQQLKDLVSAKLTSSNKLKASDSVHQKVLEAVYSLVSASLISINRTCPLQNVTLMI
ncbi:hypothetical protein GUITHDRAFT_136767 [Guillardia theta CCMP2712]|uniref:Uncharacterized protein n=1 Tax=Guillardia theta (strain CCMP2712) TaxID=905079 RepID=L1JJH9_GUITC|nr:hypothetical protein GUITHDRAFT_136767 [Guillardia theta CCMP2712]EKX48245.1 hypothetical protein GUITHDRAFT_136767 [Guillardia theta CCMP2712]|eukprot:XP_005835225.1 hypothetical protein GUITHDRAFT_136767 [Guillardia theta CCMP2712]